MPPRKILKNTCSEITSESIYVNNGCFCLLLSKSILKIIFIQLYSYNIAIATVYMNAIVTDNKFCGD